MTNNETIQDLKYLIQHDDYGSLHKEAIELAIKALEKKPCKDAISRDTAMLIVMGANNSTDAIRQIQELPSVTPIRPQKGEWIPVAKGLPKEGARVLISLKIKSTKKVVRSATYYGEGCFHSDTGDFWNIQEDIELLAWQPLPKSYEEEEE